MITVHHLENSQSIRILWLLEELGVSYQIQHYQRNKKSALAPPELRQLHRVGTSPIITEGELVLPETNAIVQYILDKYGDNGLVPQAGTTERNRYLYWMHAAQGTIVPLMYMQLVFSSITRRAPLPIKPIINMAMAKTNNKFLQPKINNVLAQIEADLSESTWFAGEQFSVADIVMGYCMEVAQARCAMDERYPNAQDFLQRMRARPAYIIALRKNGPFEPLAL